jgi:hypothetical protein
VPTDTATIVAGLERTPLLTIAVLSSTLDAHARAHGIYSWWLIHRDALPEVRTTAHPSEPVGLLYVGIGPGTSKSRRTLRERFGDHTRDTGHSTLRRSLAALLFEREGWWPYWTDRPLLEDEDNDALTDWQTEHLRVQWLQVPTPWDIERDIVHAMRPPLNRTHNRAHPFYKRVGKAREQFAEAAKTAGTRPS